MSTRWVVLSLVVGWSLAAAVIGWSGYWIAQTHRYDDCKYVELSTMTAYLCPVSDTPAPVKPPKGDEA